jgi:hypothetical protein
MLFSLTFLDGDVPLTLVPSGIIYTGCISQLAPFICNCIYISDFHDRELVIMEINSATKDIIFTTYENFHYIL